MKPSFSLNDAVGAPFVLIRRRPLAVFVWGLLMIAVVAAIYSLLIPLVISLPWSEGAAAMDARTPELLKFQTASNGLTLVMYLLMLLTFNAAGRATLSPARGDPFLFLRLGMDEVRVAVVVVAAFIGWYVALLLLILIGVGIGVALWPTGEATTIGVLILYGVVVFIAAVIGWCRVCLIGPTTLILGRFAFAEGWAIARGQVARLIGLHLVIWVIYMLVYVVVIAIVAAIVIGGFLAQGLVWPETVGSPQDLTPLVRPMIGPLLVTLPILAFSYGAYIAMVAVPFVRAARQLLDGVPAAPAIVEDAPPADTLQSS
jgi:hypothetical protein